MASENSDEGTAERFRKLSPSACGGVQSIDQIGTKWKIRILHNLQETEYLFNDLKRSTGASSYTLSRVLESLQEDGLVSRRVEIESPITSYYRLIEKDKALDVVFDALDEWNHGLITSDNIYHNTVCTS